MIFLYWASRAYLVLFFIGQLTGLNQTLGIFWTSVFTLAVLGLAISTPPVSRFVKIMRWVVGGVVLLEGLLSYIFSIAFGFILEPLMSNEWTASIVSDVLLALHLYIPEEIITIVVVVLLLVFEWKAKGTFRYQSTSMKENTVPVKKDIWALSGGIVYVVLSVLAWPLALFAGFCFDDPNGTLLARLSCALPPYAVPLFFFASAVALFTAYTKPKSIFFKSVCFMLPWIPLLYMAARYIFNF